jgi:hypothetical protein
MQSAFRGTILPSCRNLAAGEKWKKAGARCVGGSTRWHASHGNRDPNRERDDE